MTACAAAIPAGMREVTRAEFWARVCQPGNNVHPTSTADHTLWRDLRSGQVWGWCSVGFRNYDHSAPDGGRVYAIVEVQP